MHHAANQYVQDGSNNWIPQVGNASGVVGGTVDSHGSMQVVNYLPAGTADSTIADLLADTSVAAVALDTTKITNGASNVALTPKFAKISCSSNGVNTIVALVSAKKIRVLQWICTASAAVNFKWQSSVTPTDLTGLFYVAAAGGGAGSAFNPLGLFETIAGEALTLNLSGAIPVGGSIVYVEV